MTMMMKQVLDYLSDDAGLELVQDQLDNLLTTARMDYDCPGNEPNIMRQDLSLSRVAFDHDMDFNVSSVRCSGINVNDIRILFDQNTTVFNLNVAIDDLDIQCDIDWR